MTMHHAPKPDALPGCATPRLREALSFHTLGSASGTSFRGNVRRNTAGTGETSPGIVPEDVRAAFSDDLAAKALSWPAPTLEERIDRGVSTYGRHVVDVIGHEYPWSSLGSSVAIESFRCVGGAVYFIAGDIGAIKIGYSEYPLSRLGVLQTGSPIRLRIMALRRAPISVERQYHEQFAAHRLHGEWFTRCPEIEAEITRLVGEVA